MKRRCKWTDERSFQKLASGGSRFLCTPAEDRRDHVLLLLLFVNVKNYKPLLLILMNKLMNKLINWVTKSVDNGSRA